MEIAKTLYSDRAAAEIDSHRSQSDGAGDLKYYDGFVDAVGNTPLMLWRRGKAEETLRQMREIMGKLKLTVNEEKTRIWSAISSVAFGSFAARQHPTSPMSVYGHSQSPRKVSGSDSHLQDTPPALHARRPAHGPES